MWNSKFFDFFMLLLGTFKFLCEQERQLHNDKAIIA